MNVHIDCNQKGLGTVDLMTKENFSREKITTQIDKCPREKQLKQMVKTTCIQT